MSAREPAEDASDELFALAASLRAHAEWLVATGASGLPAATPELTIARGQSAIAPEPAARVRPAAASAPARAATGPASSAPAARAQPGPVLFGAAAAEADASATAPVPAREPPKDAAERAKRLAVLADEIRSCTRCRLHEQRTQTVFARGTGSSGVCFVGEGPGADEDQQGFPFVGKAGQLLDRMIAAMGIERDDVYVANITKCRPPNNRKPELDEMASCMPYLAEQLELVDPQVIVALGATAVQGLLGTTEGITRLRGRFRLYKGKIPVMPTFHPAFLLRNPAAKRDVWEDLQAVLKHLGRPVPARRS